MAISASQAERGVIYRRTRNAGREYLVVHRLGAKTLMARLSKRYNSLNGREMYLLSMLTAHPDWPLFLRCRRGTDHTTGRKYESKHPTLLPPDTRLRAVQSKPGYSG